MSDAIQVYDGDGRPPNVELFVVFVTSFEIVKSSDTCGAVELFFDLPHPDVPEALKQKIGSLISSKTPVTLEVRGRTNKFTVENIIIDGNTVHNSPTQQMIYIRWMKYRED